MPTIAELQEPMKKAMADQANRTVTIADLQKKMREDCGLGKELSQLTARERFTRLKMFGTPFLPGDAAPTGPATASSTVENRQEEAESSTAPPRAFEPAPILDANDEEEFSQTAAAIRDCQRILDSLRAPLLMPTSIATNAEGEEARTSPETASQLLMPAELSDVDEEEEMIDPANETSAQDDAKMATSDRNTSSVRDLAALVTAQAENTPERDSSAPMTLKQENTPEREPTSAANPKREERPGRNSTTPNSIPTGCDYSARCIWGKLGPKLENTAEREPTSATSSAQEEKPEKSPIPVLQREKVPELDVVESAERYHLNVNDPFYAHLRASTNPNLAADHPHNVRAILEQEQLAYVDAEAFEEKLTKPLVLNAELANSSDDLETVSPTIDPADLLYSDFIRSVIQAGSLSNLNADLVDGWDDIANDVDNAKFSLTPQNATEGPSTHMKDFMLPDFDLSAFLNQEMTANERQTVLFGQAITPLGQAYFRKLYTHNLISIRSALASAAHCMKVSFDQIHSLQGIRGVEDILHEDGEADSPDAASEASSSDDDEDMPEPYVEPDPAAPSKNKGKGKAKAKASRKPEPEPETPPKPKRTGARQFRDTSRTPFGRDVHVRDLDEAAADANAAEIRKNYKAINKRMENAFFWREMLYLEVRMSEVALARLDIAEACAAALVVSGDEVAASEEEKQLATAKAQWLLLGSVQKACWEKAVARLTATSAGRHAREVEGAFVALRTRHTGEIWDVVEDGRALLRELQSDETWWAAWEEKKRRREAEVEGEDVQMSA